ncbi:hypothetical protein [uncultured Clostridium sp.]|nr:hypothetical protein [uncultured Clostridium sp.]
MYKYKGQYIPYINRNSREVIVYGICIDFLFNGTVNYFRDFCCNG